jgi:hypothetical protein
VDNISEEKLVWTILDAPRIQPKDWDFFWKAWEQHAGASRIVKNDPAGNNASDRSKAIDYFKGLNIYAQEESMLSDGHWEMPFLDYKEIFPNVLDDLHAACPWAEIIFCRLWMSNVPIQYHRDFAPEDVALRAMIYDENPKTTFKVFKPSAGVSYVDLPKESNETNMFAYNNTTCLHGTDRTEGVNKIILLTLHKCVDKEQMIEHFKRSAEKYPERFKYS